MKPLLPDEVRLAAHGVWLTRSREVVIEGVSIDTRTARPGDLFLAIKGERFDGHDFLKHAGQKGCVAAVIRRDASIPDDVAGMFDGGVIGVDDTVAALGELAGYYRTVIPARVVAVTGSNGKTTTKRMIHHILSRRFRGSCSPRSFNNSIGVPLTLLGAEAGDDYVVCELGSNAPGEIAQLSLMTRPDIAVITSVAPTHLEKLGSLERVAGEKASVFTGLGEGGVGIVTGDSEPLEKALRPYDNRMIRFGRSDNVELRLTGYESDGPTQRFQINDRLWVKLPLPGWHNAMNALGAIAVSQRFTFEQEAAAQGLEDFSGAPMRLELIECGELRIINDAYNANPASVLAAADVLRDFAPKRRVMILSDMRELGTDSKRLHVELGENLGGKGVDLLVAVGALGRYIATGADRTGIRTETFKTTESARKGVSELLEDGDLVLVKGSRAMRMERVVESICSAFSSPRRGRRRMKK